MILAGHREPSKCRADAFSSVRSGRRRRPAGLLVVSGTPRRNHSPDRRVPGTGPPRSAAIEAARGLIVGEVTSGADSTEEHSAACGRKQIRNPKSEITRRTDERRSFSACDSIPHLQAIDRNRYGSLRRR